MGSRWEMALRVLGRERNLEQCPERIQLVHFTSLHFTDPSLSSPLLPPSQELPASEVAEARAASSMWTAEHLYPLLPWSCIVLESVPEATTHVQRAAPVPVVEKKSVPQATTGVQRAAPAPAA